MGNPLRAVPWQVQAIGAGIGAMLVIGYFASKRIAAAGAQVSSAAAGAVSNVENPWAGKGVAALAYDPSHSYLSLLADSLTSGAALNALGLRAYLAATGPLNLDGTITQPDGSRVALIFNSTGGVTGSKIVTPALNTGSIGGGW